MISTAAHCRFTPIAKAVNRRRGPVLAAGGSRNARHRLAGVALAATAAILDLAGGARGELRYQADEWIAECSGVPGSRGSCSITVPFWEAGDSGKGSFALVVMLQTGDVGLVGTPPPVRAVLRVDSNPQAVCQGQRYCIFPAAQSLAVLRELEHADLILIDVDTAKGQFSFSLSPKGYAASVAQIRAWGYALNTN
jgi:hypothetical protein